MRLHYYRDAEGNFGDDLNAWLWPRLIPDLLDDDDSVVLVGVGTLLNETLPPKSHLAVFGSGAGYGARPAVDERWRVYCVRGPLTARALRLPPVKAVTDAALLVRGLVTAQPRSPRVAFIPHHTSTFRARLEGVDLPASCAEAGMEYVDPAAPVADVLRVLGAVELVVAEAMHGAIVADALRTPWVPVVLYDHISSFKWQDWCGSLRLGYSPVQRRLDTTGVPEEVSQVLARARSSTPVLSDDHVMTRAHGTLLEHLAALRQDVQEGRLPSRVGATTASTPSSASARSPGKDEWQSRVLAAAAEVGLRLPSDATLALVDGGQWMVTGRLAGRRVRPFATRNGIDVGAPADDDDAIAALAQLLRAGTQFLVFAWPAFWWFDVYPGLLGRLEQQYPCIHRDGDVVVYDLRTTAPAGSRP